MRDIWLAQNYTVIKPIVRTVPCKQEIITACTKQNRVDSFWDKLNSWHYSVQLENLKVQYFVQC